MDLTCDVTVSANPNPGQTVDSDWVDTDVTGLMDAGATGSPCVEAYDDRSPQQPGRRSAGVSGLTHRRPRQRLVRVRVVRVECGGAPLNHQICVHF